MSDENGDGMVSAEEARGLLEKATPGPWRSGWDCADTGEDVPLIYSVHPEPGDYDGKVVFGMWYDGPRTACTEKNAALLAAAPDLARTVIALHKRLEGVGVVECLAARDAATRERARADKAERERDEARETNKRLHRRTQQTEADVESLRCIVPVGAPHRSDVVEFLRAYSVAAKVWRAAGRPVFPGQSGVGGLWPLHEWVAHVASERDRLARILAVERGDESQAPEGWSCGPGGWCVRGPDGQDVSMISREETDGPWVWWVHPDGDEEREGTAPSALEAMEAADAAREGSDG